MLICYFHFNYLQKVVIKWFDLTKKKSSFLNIEHKTMFYLKYNKIQYDQSVTTCFKLH